MKKFIAASLVFLFTVLALLPPRAGFAVFAADEVSAMIDMNSPSEIPVLPEAVVKLYQEGGIDTPMIAAQSRMYQSTPEDQLRGLVDYSLRNFQTSIDISSLKIPYTEYNWSVIHSIYFDYINDHPEYFYVVGKLNPGSAIVDPATGYPIFGTLGASFIDTPENCRSMQAAFNAEVNRALAAVPQGVSDAEKALAINDYLAYNTEYDHDRLKAGTIPDASYSAYGTLVNRISVCHGYSLAFELLMRKLDVEALFVASDKMNHAWNLVKADGFWYHVDVTWNDPVPEKWGRVSHNNFLLSDSGITATGHHSWSYNVPLATSAKYDNYFWRSVESAFIYDGYIGEWLYADAKTLKGYSFTSNSHTTKMNFSGNSQTTPYIGRYGSRIYYNADDGVRYINISDYSGGIFYTAGPVPQLRMNGSQMWFKTTQGAEIRCSSLPLNDVRIYGDNRVKTAVEVSRTGWKSSSDNIVLASSQSFPDALAGAPLAYALEAPILLTKGTSSVLEPEVFARIAELKAKKIYILGGEGVVSAGIEQQLESAGYNPERLFGNDRYETSVAIAEKLYERSNIKSKYIFIADGLGFADALSAAPVAARMNAPILFTPHDKSGLNPVTSDFISSSECFAANAVILGGESAVGSAAQTAVSESGLLIERVYGSDRYETSAQIYNRFQSLFPRKTALMATGRDFPDALSGAALAARLNAPIFLVDGTGRMVSYSIISSIRFMAPDTIYVLGGDQAVSGFILQEYTI